MSASGLYTRSCSYIILYALDLDCKKESMQCHAFSAYSKAQQGARVECHDRSSFFGEKKTVSEMKRSLRQFANLLCADC
jgi:hypothetical protein